MNPQKPRYLRPLVAAMVLLYLAIIGINTYMEYRAAPDLFRWWPYLANIPLLSIPLVLLFGSVYVLVNANYQRKESGQVDEKLAKFIHIAPRIAAGMIIFFISLFSLDMFGTGAPLLEQVGGFLMHNIPTFLLLGLLFFTWKRPYLGFYAFLLAALVFAAFFVRATFAVTNLIFFVFPLLMVALLFYADWKWIDPPQTT